MIHFIHNRPFSIISIFFWNMSAAFVILIGKTLYFHHFDFTVNAVFSLSSFCKGICQYPEVKSNMVIYFALSSVSKASFILGIK